MAGNQYVKQVVPLMGGLDYSSDVLSRPPGALSECLNFETVDYMGYKRIDGFERFDGTISPSAIVEGPLNVGSVNAGSITNIEPGDYMFYDGAVKGVVLYKQTTTPLNKLYYAKSFGASIPNVPSKDVTVKTDMGDEVVTLSSIASTSISTTAATLPTLDMTDVLASINTVRDRKVKFNQSRVAHGLHYFKERLYAVVDFEHVFIVQLDTNANGVSFGVVVPGDILVSSDGTKTARVLDIEIIEGQWGASVTGDDAAIEAKILIQRLTGEPASANANLFDTLDELGVRRNNTTTADVMTVRDDPEDLEELADNPTWLAGLYYSQSEAQANYVAADYGWQQVTHPWEFEYKEGNPVTGLPPTELARKYREAGFNTEDEPSDTGYTAGGTLTPSTDFSGSASDIANDDGTYAFVSADSGTGAFTLGASAVVTGFDFSEIPEDALITGVEVKLLARLNPTTVTAEPLLQSAPPYISGMLLVGGPEVGQNKGNTGLVIDQITDQTFTFGGVYDKFGISELGTNAVRSANFGVKIAFGRQAVTGSLAGLDCIDVEQVAVKVYYTQPTTKYYFWNGTNDVVADVIRVHTAKGSWDDESAKAAGTIIVTNVLPYDPTTAGSQPAPHRNNISINDEMRTAPAQGGDLIAVVTSNMVVCALPSLSKILEEDSRYEIITANFYGDANWQAMYGCSGAGRAFSYDGTYFQKIFTGAPIEKDKPRHVRSYKTQAGTDGALALGYISGSLFASVPGEPENFDGAGGAKEVSVGSRIVGLANMQGTTLGIFALDGVYGIKGLADDDQLYSLRAKAGAIEYSVQEMGNDVVFADVYGIHRLSQSDLYGDFLGQPLSFRITSWLQPRLRKLTTGTQVNADGVFHNSYIVRASNQYRMLFRDGYVLTMTLKGQEGTPEFTTQRYHFESEEVEYIYVPIAVTSGIDENGRERVFFSCYADYLSVYEELNVLDRTRYVFEANKGWSFDGEPIQCYFTASYNFFDSNLFEFKIVNKVQAYGKSKGLATLNLTAGKEFESVSTQNDQNISLSTGTTLQSDFVEATKLANIAKRGQMLRLKLSGNETSPEPSYVVQSLLLQYTINKGVE